MTQVSFAALVLRMVISLAIVLGIVLGAYAIIRRRQGLGSSRSGGGGGMFAGLMPRGKSPSRSMPGSKSKSRLGIGRSSMKSASMLGGRAIGKGSSKMPGSRRGLRVVGRVGIGRTSQVVAVQFAEKVFLLGASDATAPTILAELDMAQWLEATEAPEDAGIRYESITDPTAASAGAPVGAAATSSGVPGLLQALRDMTVRRV
ncbi:MAG: hypothetical protein JWN99_2355 [Ilumatobacteraceae bacterium]|nr:hypothetical protein [Ilumatobacteraceae bacterium]